jgi:hypothetical protein
VALLSPGATGILRGSEMAGGSRTLDAVQGVIDAVEPGIKVHVQYGYPGLQGTIALSGHTISFKAPDFSESHFCRWGLPNLTLYQGQRYAMWLEGTSLKVAADG